MYVYIYTQMNMYIFDLLLPFLGARVPPKSLVWHSFHLCAFNLYFYFIFMQTNKAEVLLWSTWLQQSIRLIYLPSFFPFILPYMLLSLRRSARTDGVAPLGWIRAVHRKLFNPWIYPASPVSRHKIKKMPSSQFHATLTQGFGTPRIAAFRTLLFFSIDFTLPRCTAVNQMLKSDSLI